MIKWPERLKYLADRGSYTLTPGPPTLRSDFESGPARMRRRFTTSVPEISFSVTMTSEDFEIFKSFYHWTLAQGTNWFAVKLWAGQIYSEHTARFIEHYAAADFAFGWTRVSFSLEARELSIINEGTSWILGEYGADYTCGELHDPLQTIVNIDWPSVTENY